jgi:hypothetical protein
MPRNASRLVVIAVVAVVAFTVGYWPQHERYLNVLEELRASDKQMMTALARQRVYFLENMMLQVLDLTAHKEFKEAQTLTAQFFVEVRSSMARPDMTQYSAEFKSILDKSDAINDALQKEDPASRDILRGVMQQLARIATPPQAANEPPPVVPAPPAPQN